MICGIALIIDPNREDAAQMHEILESFLRSTPEAAGRETDVATQRELKIVEFLRNKIVAGQATNSRPVVNGEAPVLPTSENSAQSMRFPQSDARQPEIPVGPRASPMQSSPQRASFPSGIPPASQPFGPIVPSPQVQGYTPASDILQAPSILDTWGYNYDVVDGTALSGTEQWAGGSDMVPELMVSTMNGQNPDGEWSYWEALVNHIRVGGPGMS